MPAAQEPGGWSCTKLACASDHLLGAAGRCRTQKARGHGSTVCCPAHGLRATSQAYPASSTDARLRRHPLPPGRARIRRGPRRRAAAGGAAGVAHCVLPAVDVAGFDAVRALAHQHGDSYALGIHPLCTREARDEDLAVLDRRWPRCRDDPRLVAVGEIGLDYFVPGLDRAPGALLPRAVGAGARHGLPVILHVRRSADRCSSSCASVPVARHRPRLQRQRAAGAGVRRARLQARLRRRRDLRARAAAPAARRRRCRCTALVLETDAPDIPPHWLYRTAAAARGRAGAAPQRAGRAAAHRPGGGRPARHGRPKRWPRRPRATRCEALPRLAPCWAADNRRAVTAHPAPLPEVNFSDHGDIRYLHLGTEWVQGSMRHGRAVRHRPRIRAAHDGLAAVRRAGHRRRGAMPCSSGWARRR